MSRDGLSGFSVTVLNWFYSLVFVSEIVGTHSRANMLYTCANVMYSNPTLSEYLALLSACHTC